MKKDLLLCALCTIATFSTLPAESVPLYHLNNVRSNSSIPVALQPCVKNRFQFKTGRYKRTMQTCYCQTQPQSIAQVASVILVTKITERGCLAPTTVASMLSPKIACTRLPYERWYRFLAFGSMRIINRHSLRLLAGTCSPRGIARRRILTLLEASLN